MKRSSLLLALVLLWAIPTAVAQEGQEDPYEADRAALRALVAAYEETVRQADPEIFRPHLDPDFTGVMLTGTEVESFDSLNAYWKRIQGMMGEGGTYSVVVHITGHALINGDLAVARGTSEDVVTTGAGEVYRVEGRWTAICRRNGDQWKVLRIHASMDPIDNEFVMAAVKGATRLAGGVSGAGGLVLGFLAAVVLRRLRRRSG